jgi:hypothetical protein
MSVYSCRWIAASAPAHRRSRNISIYFGGIIRNMTFRAWTLGTFLQFIIGGIIRKKRPQRCPVSLSSHIGAQA